MISLTLLLKTNRLLNQETLEEIDTIVLIGDKVSSYFNLTYDEIKSKSRKRHIVYPRQLIHYFLWKTAKFSLETIGNNVGGKSHCTVMYSRDTIYELLDSNIEVRYDVMELTRKLKKYL
jgi:chromosomal replication initiator protein